METMDPLAEIQRLRKEVAAWKGPAFEPVVGEYYMIDDEQIRVQGWNFTEYNFVYKFLGRVTVGKISAAGIKNWTPDYGEWLYQFQAPVWWEAEDGRMFPSYFYLEAHQLSTMLHPNDNNFEGEGGVHERPGARGYVDDPFWRLGPRPEEEKDEE